MGGKDDDDLDSFGFVVLKYVLIFVDFVNCILTFGWIGAVKKALSGEPVRSVPVADDESHRVMPEYKGNLARTPRGGITTLENMAEFSYKNFPDNPCMRSRDFIGWKTPKIKEFGPDIKELSYREVGEKAHKFGAALRKSGCVPAPKTTNLKRVTTPCRMAIFENTCSEWLIAALGAFSQSITVTTVYATLGIDAVIEAVNDNEIPVILCNKLSVSKIVDKIGKMKKLKTIVYTNDLVPKDDKTQLPKAPAGVSILSFDEYVETGDVKAFPVTEPVPDTTAVIMYTSGSTGKPKGVVISHKSILAAAASADILLHMHDKDKYLAYLPLAHIMELMVEFVVLAKGCCLCYADPKSLSATGSAPIGALEAFSPTLMVAVPKIWETLRKGIMAKVAQSPAAAQVLVNTAFEWRVTAKKYGFTTPLFSALVFKKFKKAVGGELRWALSGGGPLSGKVQDFIRVAFDIPLVQGYGLTETCAGLAIQAEDDLRHGVQGMPIPSCEVKLDSTPDVKDRAGLPYLSTDRKDVEGNDVWGRGEICVRGFHVTSGYYMEEEKTKEEFKEDGWFHSGDIGEFLKDGSIRIVDRKKNLVKLKGGEYIALEQMESVYGGSNFVDAIAGGICCYGDGEMDRPIALMQLSEPYAKKWAQKNGASDDISKLKDDSKLYDAIMDDLKQIHGGSGLSHLEKLVAVSILTDHWTPENGCLTAANKLQRRVVIETFSKEFEEVKKKGVF